MAALVCDICGGKLAMGSGGIAVCDSCGMEHTKERMQEKVQEIKGTVRVDNSHMVSNYLNMAETAYEADNKSETESYCNKIIEIDPQNYRAWLLKGKSAGWQSSIGNNRFSEAATCFAKAIELSPEDAREDIVNQSTTEMKNLSIALISLRGNRFSKWPDSSEAQGFIDDIVAILGAVATLLIKGGAATSDYMESFATIINNSVMDAWNNKIVPDYRNDDDSGHPGDFAFKQLLDQAGNCTVLLDKAIGLSDDDEEADIVRYENLISIHEFCISSCSWDYDFIGDYKSWHKKLTLNDSAVRSRRTSISQYQAKIAEIKGKKAAKEKADADTRFKKYWEDHADEKFKLEAELQNLKLQIAALNAEISSVPGKAEESNIQEGISKLKADKDALSLFKGKEKKVIQEQIDTATAELKSVTARRNAFIEEIKQKITPLEKRVSAINAEFTKDR